MRWAHRRLALLGVPIDFLYSGAITEPQKLLHALPFREDFVIDSGWGYVGTLTKDVDAHHWLQLIGTARLLPRDILRWLVAEAADDFEHGNVFVAPAELVGLSRSPTADQEIPLADVARATRLSDIDKQAQVLFHLALPFIDDMSPEDFAKLRRDEAESFADFRIAFRAACMEQADSEDGAREAGKRLQHEAREITHAVRFQRFRHFVTKLNGKLKTFGAFIGGLTAAGAIYTRDPFAGAAAATGATKVLYDLWQQSQKIDPNLSGMPFRLFWKLGVSDLKCSTPPTGTWTPKAHVQKPDTIDPHHWLCPPTAGLLLGGVIRNP
jgi:hypothetical protein